MPTSGERPAAVLVAGTWPKPVVGADVPGGPPPARDVRQSDLVRGAGRARGTRAPTMTFARAKNLVRSAIPEELVERINISIRIGVHSPELDHMIFVLTIDLKRVYAMLSKEPSGNGSIRRTSLYVVSSAYSMRLPFSRTQPSFSNPSTTDLRSESESVFKNIAATWFVSVLRVRGRGALGRDNRSLAKAIRPEGVFEIMLA